MRVAKVCILHNGKYPVFNSRIISAAAAHLLQRSPGRDPDLRIAALRTEQDGVCHRLLFFV